MNFVGRRVFLEHSMGFSRGVSEATALWQVHFNWLAYLRRRRGLLVFPANPNSPLHKALTINLDV
ncbi:hypothetical protein [Bradyrhizobium sp. LTSPM299]|uniref:hypothetical protein n=1 Tax=Bradyrhizobium sp. LTSPM299 TaxID=1619233 RepID=UPI0012E2E069|nr:hypothetical protein [Bradyrhizobium sp. LTSPM299]